MVPPAGTLDRTRVWVRVAWPLFLIVRFTVYAFVDSPTHFFFWPSGRTLHATFYMVAVALVAVTIGPTPRRILELKALAIWVIAFSSVIGDLVVHSHSASARWNSTVSWLGLVIANQIAILLRLSASDEIGKA